eukprot:g15071.t1
MSQATSNGDGSSGGISGFSEGREAGGQRGGGGGGGRSALISDLVAQLKRGDISKTELFSRLQQLQGQASVTGGTATSGSAGGADGADGTPVNLSAGNGNAITAVRSTASSGGSSVAAAGTTAAESAGFFSAYDRQAIIQKIADERRRRAEQARLPLPFPRSPSSSIEFSTSVVQSSPIAVASSATSQSSLPMHHHHQQQQHQQQQQQRLSSSLRNVPEHNDGGTAGRSAAAPSGYRGQPAWEQRLGQQQAASEAPAASTCDAIADEFPFPDTQGRAYNGGGADSRPGRRNIEAESDGSGAPSGRGGGESAQGKDGASSRPAAAAVPRRSSRSAEKATRRLSRSGSDSQSHSQSRSHERLQMHTFSSRRRSSSSSSFGSPDRGGPSSPGWSSHARRLSGADDADAGGPERGGAARSYSYQAAPGSAPAAGRHLAQDKEDNFDGAPLREAWAQEGAGGGEAKVSSNGAPSMPLRGAGVPAAKDKDQESELDAAGRKDWVESVGAWGEGEEGARREALAGQQRGEWKGGGSGRSGGGEQQQAGERMVDEDAYRFRSFSEERARRGEELVRRELMSECTFRPKIKGLPPSYGATNHDDPPFLQRVSQWQRDKEKDADARKADGKVKELEECTFTPRVNSVSRRAARSRRQALGENHLTVDDRLYDESVRRDMDRSHLAAEQAAREEERLHRECTFKPDLPTKRAAAAAAAAGEGAADRDWGYTVPRGRSRYRQAAAAVAAAVATGGGGSGSVWGAGRRANGARGGGGGGGRTRCWELESCTFTPNVIGARKGMDQAQQYLQYDVVDRLTGVAFRPADDDEDGSNSHGSEEGEAFLREGGGTLRGAQRRAFGRGSGGAPGAACGSGCGEKDEELGVGCVERGAASDTSSSFHAFLSRQNKMETDKLKHIEQIQVMQQYTFKPEICPESTKIHQESNKGDFLQRVAREAARKEHEAVRQKAAGLHDPDCTFKPKITARSANLQARSVVELSRGDQLKRETTQRLTRLRAEQELLADTTFRPRINADAASRMAVSKLKVVSDPGNYIATVENLRRRKEESVVRGAIEKAAKEVEGCTFRPETTECPAYITRIAKSISASKALPASAGGKKKVRPIKPDWR